MGNCIGLIDGIAIGIALPSGYETHLVAYNGYKRNHELKYEAVNSPDGMILHAYGPIEVRCHDWTLDVRSGQDEQPTALLSISGKRYCRYGHLGYSRMRFMEITYQGSKLSVEKRAFSKAMSSSRITLEYIFKEAKI